MESRQSSDGTAITYARAGSGPPLVRGVARDHTVSSATPPRVGAVQ